MWSSRFLFQLYWVPFYWCWDCCCCCRCRCFHSSFDFTKDLCFEFQKVYVCAVKRQTKGRPFFNTKSPIWPEMHERIYRWKIYICTWLIEVDTYNKYSCKNPLNEYLLQEYSEHEWSVAIQFSLIFIKYSYSRTRQMFAFAIDVSWWKPPISYSNIRHPFVMVIHLILSRFWNETNLVILHFYFLCFYVTPDITPILMVVMQINLNI